MSKRSNRALWAGAGLVAVLTTVGCALVLGIEEYDLDTSSDAGIGGTAGAGTGGSTATGGGGSGGGTGGDAGTGGSSGTGGTAGAGGGTAGTGGSAGAAGDDAGAGGDDAGDDVDAGPTRVTDGLSVLYTFEEGSGVAVHDVSGVGQPLDLALVNPANVNWIPGGVEIVGDAVITAVLPATKIVDACRATNELTVEAWVKPANLTQFGPARIITLTQDAYAANFMLGQNTDQYVMRVRTPSTQPDGIPSFATSAATVTLDLSHVVYTFTAATGAETFYVNGQPTQSGNRTGGDLSNWNNTYLVGIGNEPTAPRLWLGEIHLAAVYCRALGLAEVIQNHLVGAD